MFVDSIVFSSGMLPNAVLPPSLDHNYAQWQEREENSHTEQPPLMKKIIPAPKPKGPGEPDSPTPLHPPTPPILSKAPNEELIFHFSLYANDCLCECKCNKSAD